MYEPGFRRSFNLQPLVAITVYRGDGDFVFYRRDLLRKDMRWLMLVMHRPGYEYRYVWRFYDGEPSTPEIEARQANCASVRDMCQDLVASSTP